MALTKREKHALKRLKRRYSIDGDASFLSDMEAKIERWRGFYPPHEVVFVKRNWFARSRAVYRVRYLERWFLVVYDETPKHIITFLTQEELSTEAPAKSPNSGGAS